MNNEKCKTTRSENEFLRFFEELARIPHGSGNTDGIADYLCRFAAERSLSYVRDGANNVIIRKPATAGLEDRPTVILQGHHDMVEAVAPDCKKDMKTEGLDLYRDGDFLRARGTTLGGDDGIALAYALAILDSNDIAHPAIEALFTSDEEIGLLGAVALDGNHIKGRTLINIDSDVEGIFTVGCAGGMRTDITLPILTERTVGSCYRIECSGFKGGHSGAEIDKGRANAIKVLGGCLAAINDARVCHIEGGNADNAIPRSAYAIVATESDPTERVAAYIDSIRESDMRVEDEAKITVTPCESADMVLAPVPSARLVSLINALPSGIIAMSEDIPGLVETSLNLGIISTTKNAVELCFSVRSAKSAAKRAIGDRIGAIAEEHCATFSERGEYPAWEYRPKSHLCDVMKEVYEQMYGKSPEIVTIHAGLECGIFSEKLDGLDCVSIGPDNFDIHTTEEHLSISSSVRVYEFLIEVLGRI